MATQKPISSISYNTLSFFESVVKELYDQHIICNYMYILHKGEDGDKDHIHFYLEPNRRLDPMEIKSLFFEVDLKHPDKKPLGIRPFRPSKESDWILYAVHDEQYLKLKYGQFERGEKIPYSFTDIKAPEDFDMEIAFIRAKSTLKHSSASLATRLRNGEHILHLIEQGENVVTLNAIANALRNNDYLRMSEENRRLRLLVSFYQTFIEQQGLKECADCCIDFFQLNS